MRKTMYVVPPNPLLHQLQTLATQTPKPPNPFSPNSHNPVGEGEEVTLRNVRNGTEVSVTTVCNI